MHHSNWTSNYTIKSLLEVCIRSAYISLEMRGLVCNSVSIMVVA